MTLRHETKVPKLDVVLPPSADGSSFAIWRAASAPQVEIALPEGARPQDVFIDGANYQLPHAVLTRVRASAQRLRCAPEERPAEAASTVQFYLYLAGTSENLCEGRRERLGPGDIVIYDSRRGYEAEVTAFDVRIVMASHDRVPPILLSPAVHGLKLPAGAGGTRLLAGAMESLLSEIEGLDMAEADAAVTALLHLAAGVVEGQLARQDRGRRRWADPELDAGMAYIERHCTDIALTPDAVRRHLRTSRSALYRLFAPLGGIEVVIRQRRLDHAMRALLTDASPMPPLKDFAARYGFRSETHCVRAFQARFGTTPLKAHAKIASRDRAWLMAQAGRAGLSSLKAWLAALATGFPEEGEPAERSRGEPFRTIPTEVMD